MPTTPVDPLRRRLIQALPAALATLGAGLLPGRPAQAASLAAAPEPTTPAAATSSDPQPAAAPAATPESGYDPLRQVWRCTFNECDPYYYDPARGDDDNINGPHPIPPGTAFEDLPDDWLCPICASPKSYFVKDHQRPA